MNIDNITIEETSFGSTENIEQKLNGLPQTEIDSGGRLRAYTGVGNVIHIEPVKGERILGIKINEVYISHTNGNGHLPFRYQDQKFELHYRPSD